MGVLVELIIAGGLLLLSFQFGWFGVAACLTAFAISLGFHALPISERAHLRLRWVIFLALFIWFGLLLAWMIWWRLDTSPSTPDNGMQFADLFRRYPIAKPSQVLGALLAGFAIMSIPAAFVLLLGLLLRQNTGDWQESWSALQRSLGLRRVNWTVRAGQVESADGSGASDGRPQGPGDLLVQEGHAAILEKDGRVSRVVGQGVIALSARERLGLIVPLYGRSEQVVVENVVTQDELIVQAIELSLNHRVDPGEGFGQIQDSQYPYNASLLTSKIWSAGGKDWAEGVKAIAKRETRNVVGEYEFEKLIRMSCAARQDFLKRIEDAVNGVTQKHMGVRVTMTGLGRITVPPQAEQELMDRWLAERDCGTTLTRSNTETEIVTQQAEARGKALQQLLGGASAAMSAGGFTVQDLIAIGFAEYLIRHNSARPEDGGKGNDVVERLLTLEALKHLAPPSSPPSSPPPSPSSSPPSSSPSSPPSSSPLSP